MPYYASRRLGLSLRWCHSQTSAPGSIFSTLCCCRAVTSRCARRHRCRSRSLERLGCPPGVRRHSRCPLCTAPAVRRACCVTPVCSRGMTCGHSHMVRLHWGCPRSSRWAVRHIAAETPHGHIETMSSPVRIARWQLTHMVHCHLVMTLRGGTAAGAGGGAADARVRGSWGPGPAGPRAAGAADGAGPEDRR